MRLYTQKSVSSQVVIVVINVEITSTLGNELTLRNCRMDDRKGVAWLKERIGIEQIRVVVPVQF
jgi:hypothetical protein